LRRLLAENGRLSEKLINETEHTPSSETVANRFGSLLAAYAAVGYAPPSDTHPFGQNGKYWSKRAVLNGLQKLYSQAGHISNRLIDRFPDLPSQCNIRRRFGSIPEAMRQAGLPVISYGESQRLSWMRRKAAGWDDYILGIRWTSERLLRALRKLEEHYGYVSVNLLDQNNITPRAYYFIKRFGSLAKARALAKLPARSRSQIMLGTVKRKREGKAIGRKPRHPEDRSRRRYRSDDILFGLKRLAKRKGIVSARLIDEDPNLPSWCTVANYFGSLSAAYRLAGLVRLNSKLVRFGLAK
jgi:hypothetical protein